MNPECNKLKTLLGLRSNAWYARADPKNPRHGGITTCRLSRSENLLREDPFKPILTRTRNL
jgi:hypothetical protein